MGRRLRLYYYALLGALGGLFAWQLTDAYLVFGRIGIFAIDIVLGAVLGSCIGGAIQSGEAFLNRTWLRGLRGLVIGGLLGAIGGAAGLPAGEWVFRALGGEFIGRIAGWTILGAAIGLAESMTSGVQAGKGVVGGALGGALGGAILEGIHRRTSASGWSAEALGLVLLGATTGLVLSLVISWLASAWLEVQHGKDRTTVYLDKYLLKHSKGAIIGSDQWKADIYLGGDKAVAPQHASLVRDREQIVLRDLETAAGTYVNGHRLTSPHALGMGDEIMIGGIRVLYRERRTVRPLVRS